MPVSLNSDMWRHLAQWLPRDTIAAAACVTRESAAGMRRSPAWGLHCWNMAAVPAQLRALVTQVYCTNHAEVDDLRANLHSWPALRTVMSAVDIVPGYTFTDGQDAQFHDRGITLHKQCYDCCSSLTEACAGTEMWPELGVAHYVSVGVRGHVDGCEWLHRIAAHSHVFIESTTARIASVRTAVEPVCAVLARVRNVWIDYERTWRAAELAAVVDAVRAHCSVTLSLAMPPRDAITVISPLSANITLWPELHVLVSALARARERGAVIAWHITDTSTICNWSRSTPYDMQLAANERACSELVSYMSHVNNCLQMPDAQWHIPYSVIARTYVPCTECAQTCQHHTEVCVVNYIERARQIGVKLQCPV